MTPNHEREEALFDAARDIPTPEARAAFLEKACDGDAALRERVEGLLRDDAAAQEYFRTGEARTRASSVLSAEMHTVPVTEQPGSVIGRYKLREKLGEGGCGVVYVAEQEEPVRRRVALKILKLGLDTASVVARFEAERQALAVMDHPNIARVFDAGTTATGRPYFVMELVRGTRLTEYCERHALPVKARLELFVKICRAVQHAHQKGIIHRDLKPSNILVTLHDGVPVPKIIDFGIAKATEGRLTDLTIYTQIHQFLGTPAYMSPEQAEMSGLDVDTRSDIYSLGVLLYELLTGVTPFDARELAKAGLDEMLRIIREKEPVKPSTRLTLLDASSPPGPHTPARPPLASDLDWIVMKALEKDRTRRYDTANGLAMDVERFLQNEPVLACPPSPLYRLRKLARRNRAAFVAVTVVAVVIGLGLFVSSWQAVRATRAQAQESEARRAADEARRREGQERQRAEDAARLAEEGRRNARQLLYASDMRLAQAAWDEGNLGTMSRLLQAHEPAPGREDLRTFEFFLLKELARGEQDYALEGHTNRVVCLAVSPDGKWLATRSETDTRLWDLTQRRPVATFASARAILGNITRTHLSVSFSHDSRYLAYPSAEGLQFFDLVTYENRRVRDGKFERPLFAPKTARIAFTTGGEEGQALVWDYDSNREPETLGPSILPCAWSPDEARLLTAYASGMAGELWWRDAKTLKPVETNRVGQYISGTAVAPGGRRLAAADWQGAISILEVPGGKALGDLDAGDIRSSALAFSPDGRILVTSGRDQAILVWNVETRERVRTMRGHFGKVAALAFFPNEERLASGDENGRVLVWDLNRRTRWQEIPNRLAAFGGNPPQFSPDGRFLAAPVGRGHTRIFDTSRYQPVAVNRGSFIGFSPDSRQWAFSTRQNLGTSLQVSTAGSVIPRTTVRLDTGGDRGSSIEISPDGRYLVTHDAVQSPDPDLNVESRLFDATTRERLAAVPTTGMALVPSQFMPDGRTWVCASGSKLEFWDLPTRSRTRSVEGGATILCVAVSPDGRWLATARVDHQVALWDLESAGEPVLLTGHQALVWALAFSPDGRTLVSGSEDRTVRFWSVAALRETATTVESRPVYWLAFSPDSQSLLVGGVGSYRIWRAPNGDAAAKSASGPTERSVPTTGGLWSLPDGEAGPGNRPDPDQEQCRTNLLAMHRAIVAYRAATGQMPDGLGDLVPGYLTDTNCLRCPAHARALPGSGLFWTDDPKVRTSYAYEFSARPNPYRDASGLAQAGDTMKAWKTRQLAEFGGLTPVVRCEYHGRILNLDYSGEIWESAPAWEPAAAARLRVRDPNAFERWERRMEQEAGVVALNALAWAWATSGDESARFASGAVRLAERNAERTQRQDPSLLDTLAAAYAEAGQFERAAKVQEEALALVRSREGSPGGDVLEPEFEHRLEWYRQRRPYRAEE